MLMFAAILTRLSSRSWRIPLQYPLLQLLDLVRLEMAPILSTLVEVHVDSFAGAAGFAVTGRDADVGTTLANGAVVAVAAAAPAAAAVAGPAGMVGAIVAVASLAAAAAAGAGAAGTAGATVAVAAGAPGKTGTTVDVAAPANNTPGQHVADAGSTSGNPYSRTAGAGTVTIAAAAVEKNATDAPGSAAPQANKEVDDVHIELGPLAPAPFVDEPEAGLLLLLLLFLVPAACCRHGCLSPTLLLLPVPCYFFLRKWRGLHNNTSSYVQLRRLSCRQVCMSPPSCNLLLV